MTAADLDALNGKSVLVVSARDHHNPATGVRGSIEVIRDQHDQPAVRLTVSFPAMFNESPHQRIIFLDDAGVDRLVASGNAGTYTYVVDEPINDLQRPPATRTDRSGPAPGPGSPA